MPDLSDREVEDYFAFEELPEKCPECRVKLVYFYSDDAWVCPECGYVDQKEVL